MTRIVCTVAQDDQNATGRPLWINGHALFAGGVDCIKQRGSPSCNEVRREFREFIVSHEFRYIRRSVKTDDEDISIWHEGDLIQKIQSSPG